MNNIKLSKLIHIASVIFGFVGLFMWFLLIFAWFTGASWFAATYNLTLMIGCTLFSFLAAIWLQIATIHHMKLEKKGEII